MNDDDAQVDGESPVPYFAQKMNAQPWARGGLPPWHMWGGSVVIGPVAPTFSDSPGQLPASGQIARIAYKRPETWHWVFGARILEGQVLTEGNTAIIDVYFDVITGIGRSQQIMIGFDHFRWTYDDPSRPRPPVDHVMWATTTYTPALDYTGSFLPDPASRRLITEIVGQDIQINARVSSFLQSSQELMTPQLKVEVSAFLAPKTHVRPDWFAEGPEEVQFPGAENQGR
jgi:hypothetical protein